MAESISNVARTLVTTAAAVRALTGYTAAGDVSDADLQEILRRAQARVLRDVARRVVDLPLAGGIDGANTRYRVPAGTPERVIFDHSLDLATNSSDAAVRLRTDPTGAQSHPTWADATVASIDALHGVVTLASAPAATVAAVELDAWLTPAPLDLEMLREAVEYYAAVLVERRADESGKAVLANPERAGHPRGPSYMTLYKRAVRALRPPAPRAVVSDTRLPWGPA